MTTPTLLSPDARTSAGPAAPAAATPSRVVGVAASAAGSAPAKRRRMRPVRELLTAPAGGAAAPVGRAELLLFRLGPEVFAVDIGSVEEAVELPAVHPVPDCPAHQLGVADVRGRLLPVYSPATTLGVGDAAAARVMLVMRAGDVRLGVAVDDVDDVMHLDVADVRPSPLHDARDALLLGVTRRDADLVSIIDADGLVGACTAAEGTR